MNLTIHAGAHKTATTSIQDWLRQSSRLLARNKTLYIQRGVLNEAGIIESLHNSSVSERAKDSNRFLRLLSEQSARSKVETMLISHESILSFSNMLPRAIDNGFYGSMENSAPCINILAEEYKVKLVFYVRRQDTFLASVYLEFVKRGNTYLDFQSYCDAVDYKNISWLTCLQRMSELMPNVEIVVKPFESIKDGDAAFVKAFLQAAGVEADNLLLDFSFPLSNESVSETTLLLMQACGPHVGAQRRRMLGQFFRKQFPTSTDKKAEVLTPKLSKEIVSYFAEENAQVFQQWMPTYSDKMY